MVHHLDISKYGFGFEGSGPDTPTLFDQKPKFCIFFLLLNASLRERLKKNIKLQTLSEQGGGSKNYPLCPNPILDFLNMTFKHKLYINMVKF